MFFTAACGLRRCSTRTQSRKQERISSGGTLARERRAEYLHARKAVRSHAFAVRARVKERKVRERAKECSLLTVAVDKP